MRQHGCLYETVMVFNTFQVSTRCYEEQYRKRFRTDSFERKGVQRYQTADIPGILP